MEKWIGVQVSPRPYSKCNNSTFKTFVFINIFGFLTVHPPTTGYSCETSRKQGQF